MLFSIFLDTNNLLPGCSSGNVASPFMCDDYFRCPFLEPASCGVGYHYDYERKDCFGTENNCKQLLAIVNKDGDAEIDNYYLGT